MTRFPAEWWIVGGVKASPWAAGLCKVRRNFVGDVGVNSISGSGKVALIAAALLALALGGCGRKSGLDLPPQASAQPAPASGPATPAEQRRSSNPFGLFEVEEGDRPVAAQGQKRRIILDNILD
jgi:predicted small lipoprotein YifL